MGKKADGWLITLINKQMIYTQENLLIRDKEGNYIFNATEVFYIGIGMGQNNKVHCFVQDPSKTPEKIAEIIVPEHAVVKKERLMDDSLVIMAVIKARSGIIVPDGVNVHKNAIHQGGG